MTIQQIQGDREPKGDTIWLNMRVPDTTGEAPVLLWGRRCEDGNKWTYYILYE
jgi:hypothetical protein